MTHNRCTAGFVLGTLAVVSIGMFPTKGNAIPEFARKYKTTCARCHVGFPKLNAFGKNFQLHGYQQPGDQKTGKIATPEDPNLSLIENFPIGALIKNRFELDKWIGIDRATNIESPHELELFFGDSLARDIGMFAELEWEGGEAVVGKMAVSFTHLGKQNVNLQVGALDPFEHGVTDHNRLTRAHLPYHDMGLGGLTLGGDNRGIRLFGIAGSQITPEFMHGDADGASGSTKESGAGLEGAVRGPRVSTKTQEKEEADPFDTLEGFLWEVGLYNGGGGPDDNNAKDFSARGNLYFGGDSFIGVWAYGGETAISPTIANKHRTIGVDFSLEFGQPFEKTKGVMQKPFNILGGFASGKADNPSGTGIEVNWNSFFVEGDYVIGDRSIFLMRYDKIHSDDQPSLKRELLTSNYSYYLKTNFVLAFEYTRDLRNTERDKFAILFNFAF